MRIIVGITGASGSIIGKRILEVLKEKDIETHLVITDAGKTTMSYEIGDVRTVEELATKTYDINDIGAAIASGSFETQGMIVAPCSMKTMSAIANGFEINLLVRAADACLKQRRRLILVPRETPIIKSYAENMVKCLELGAIVVPPMVPYYEKPKTVDEITDFFVGRVLDFFGIEHSLYKKWGGL